MDLHGIWLYTARAARFALAVGCAYALLRAIFLAVRRRRPDARAEALRLALTLYLAALIEITALRGANPFALDWEKVSRDAAQWVPLRTTAHAFRAGAWPFLYHVLGNLIWFSPLGCLMPLIWRRASLPWVACAAFVLSVSVECAQFAMWYRRARRGRRDVEHTGRGVGEPGVFRRRAITFWRKYTRKRLICPRTRAAAACES